MRKKKEKEKQQKTYEDVKLSITFLLSYHPLFIEPEDKNGASGIQLEITKKKEEEEEENGGDAALTIR